MEYATFFLQIFFATVIDSIDVRFGSTTKYSEQSETHGNVL